MSILAAPYSIDPLFHKGEHELSRLGHQPAMHWMRHLSHDGGNWVVVRQALRVIGSIFGTPFLKHGAHEPGSFIP